MRMFWHPPETLDQTCRISPKLEELEGILGDLLAEPDRKVIVFSEWERMLDLVRELAGEMGVEVAWHTGSVPQQRRRAEIVRFKQDPACRLFLSTDSGSVGLNLQAASAVVNVDLPWNPAKLQQRIARAWRKNQTRSVTGVNLVVDRPTWPAKRRLAASGMIVIADIQARGLHHSPDFAAAAEPGVDPLQRAAELRSDAEKSLRMARVLSAGGFAEEALPLIAKAI